MIIDAKDLLAYYFEKPRSNVLVDRKDGTLSYISSADMDDYFRGKYELNGKKCTRDTHAVFIYMNRISIQESRVAFLKHKRLSTKYSAKNISSTPLFNAFLKKHNLYEEYVSFAQGQFASHVQDFMLYSNFVEKEASDEQYLELGRCLKEFDERNYYSHFSDLHYFELNTEGVGHCEFVVLGNAGDTYGISFYLGYDGFTSFRAIHEYHDENPTYIALTIGSLAKVVNLYCDKKEIMVVSDAPTKLGQGDAYWSIAINRGILSRNRLGETTVKYLIAALKEVMRGLDALLKEDLPADFTDIPCRIFIQGKRGHKHRFYFERIPDDGTPNLVNFTGLRMYPITYQAGAKTKEDYSFLLRVVPDSYPLDEGDMRRYANHYIGFLLSLTKHKIVSHLFVEIKQDKPFMQSIVESANKAFNNLPAPKNIYVNEALDYDFAEYLFAPMIKKGTKIKMVDGPLPGDDAYCGMVKALEDEPGKA